MWWGKLMNLEIGLMLNGCGGLYLKRGSLDGNYNSLLDFCSTLKDHVACDNLKDSLIWKGAASGIYSTKQ